jgi:hypothetical protein
VGNEQRRANHSSLFVKDFSMPLFIRGLPGGNGLDGDDGREVSLRNSGTAIEWQYDGDPTWTELVTIAAITGPQGAAGLDGADGQDGAPGAAGLDGEDGAAGATGAAGPNEITTSTSTNLTGLLRGTGSAVEAATAGTHYLTEVAQDTTPQLGGDLDANGHTVHFGTAENTQTPAGTTATIDLGAENHHTLDCGSATGAVTLTLTVPPGPTAGTIIVKQGATSRDITWSPSSGTVTWLGEEPTWTGDANKYRIVAWRWNASILFLSATETN